MRSVSRTRLGLAQKSFQAQAFPALHVFGHNAYQQAIGMACLGWMGKLCTVLLLMQAPWPLGGLDRAVRPTGATPSKTPQSAIASGSQRHVYVCGIALWTKKRVVPPPPLTRGILNHRAQDALPGLLVKGTIDCRVPCASAGAIEGCVQSLRAAAGNVRRHLHNVILLHGLGKWRRERPR